MGLRKCFRERDCLLLRKKYKNDPSRSSRGSPSMTRSSRATRTSGRARLRRRSFPSKSSGDRNSTSRVLLDPRVGEGVFERNPFLRVVLKQTFDEIPRAFRDVGRKMKIDGLNAPIGVDLRGALEWRLPDEKLVGENAKRRREVYSRPFPAAGSPTCRTASRAETRERGRTTQSPQFLSPLKKVIQNKKD